VNFSLRNAFWSKILVKIAELYHLAMSKEGYKTKVPLLEEGDFRVILCMSIKQSLLRLTISQSRAGRR
jgi:hypothetical protein